MRTATPPANGYCLEVTQLPKTVAEVQDILSSLCSDNCETVTLLQSEEVNWQSDEDIQTCLVEIGQWRMRKVGNSWVPILVQHLERGAIGWTKDLTCWVIETIWKKTLNMKKQLPVRIIPAEDTQSTIFGMDDKCGCDGTLHIYCDSAHHARVRALLRDYRVPCLK